MIPSTTRAVAVLAMALSLIGGVLNLSAVGEDTDGDGIPDNWELAFGLNPNNANDAALDLDADGMTNLEEYRADTHPLNASSVLRMTSITVDTSSATLSFATRPGLLYTLEFQNSLVSNNWAVVDQIVAVGTSGNIVDSTAGQASVRSYRVSAARSATNAVAYSVNKLGFVKQNIPAGSNSITRPLLLTPDDLISTLFPVAPPDAVIYKFIPATQTYESSVYIAGLGWYDEEPFQPSQMVLLPGETFLLSTPMAFSVAFSGDLGAQPFAGNNTIIWTNVAGGNWSDPKNWIPNQVPGPTNAVFIAAPGTYTVVLDINATIASFSLGAASGTQTFIIGGHTLNSGQGFVTTNGVVILGGGTWSGTNEVNGRFVWSGLDLPALCGPGPATGGGIDRCYDDGFVRVDVSTNSGGLTWYWSYENSAQVVGDTLLLHSRKSLPDNRVQIITDTYNLNGVVPPPAPYVGTFEGPNPLIPDTPVSRNIQVVEAPFGTVARSLNISATGILEITNTSASVTAALSNGGAVLQRNAKLTGSGPGSIRNSGLWLADGDATSTLDAGVSGFTNIGTFRKTGSGLFQVGLFNNSGIVEALAGTLEFTSAYFQSAGSITVNSQINALSLFNLLGGNLIGNGVINGNVSSSVRVAPSGLSTLTINGNFTQTAPGVLEIEIGGSGALQRDQLAVSGNATLGGTLDLRLINGFSPSVGTLFPILSTAQRFGTFGAVATTPLSFVAQTTYAATGVSVSFGATPPSQPADIVVSPVDQTVNPGNTVTFSVTTVGSPPIYQWRYNGTAVPGETNSTITIPNANPTNSGVYSVVAQNDFGPAVISDPARLFVQAPNLFFADNFADRTNNTAPSGIGRGSNVGATREPGEPLHANKTGGHSVWFGWTAPANGIVTFQTRGSSFDTLLGVYTGPDVAHLTTIANDEDGGGFFSSFIRFNASAGTSYAIAIDGLGGAVGDIVLSWSLDVTATSAVPVVVSQPADRIAPPGSTVTFSAAVANADSYQWFFNGVPIPGETKAQLTITNISVANIGLYTVQIRNGNEMVMSAPAVLDLGPTTITPTVDKFEDLFSSNSIVITTGASARKPKNITSVAAGSLLSSSFGATSQTCEPVHAGVLGGVSRWQLFRFDTDGLLTINTATSSVPTVVAAYTGTSLCSLELVAQSAPNASNNFATIRFRVRAGASYPVAIDTVDGVVGLMALNWSFDPAPNLVTPFDRIAVIPGTNLFLSVNVTGGPGDLLYQWMRGTNGTDFIGGATNAYLYLTNLQSDALGIYRLAVIYRGYVIGERDIELFLGSSRPVITVEPVDANGVLGGSATFSVQLSGEPPFFYQWENQPISKKKRSRKTPTPPPFSAISGANDSTYTIPSLTKTSPGFFRLVVTNSSGSTTSRTVRLQLYKPVVITRQPRDITREAGQRVILTVKAKGDALNYQWYFADAPLPGEIFPKLTIESLQESTAGQYYVVVSNPAGSETSRLASITITSATFTASSKAFVTSARREIRLGVQRFDDQVRLSITAPVGRYEVLVSTDLNVWQAAGVIKVETGTALFVHRTNAAAAFYRLREITSTQ